jgi:hypothetical protein
MTETDLDARLATCDRRGRSDTEQREEVMREVILYMSLSLDGFVDSDREHPGMAIPEGVELKQWKLDRIGRGQALFDQLPESRHLTLVEATPFPNGVVVHTYRPQHT